MYRLRRKRASNSNGRCDVARERMTMEDLIAKLEWEGREYALTDISSDEMPEQLESLHKNARTAWDVFWAEYDDMESDIDTTEGDDD